MGVTKLNESQQTEIENAVNPGSVLITSLCGFALAEVNDIRTAVGIGEGTLDALPKGVRSNAESCVLAQALRNGWSSDIGSFIDLTRDPDNCEGIDFDKILAALRQMEFSCRILRTEPTEDEEVWNEEARQYDTVPTFVERPYGIRIDHTWVTQVFINKFDGGYIPDLEIFQENPEEQG